MLRDRTPRTPVRQALRVAVVNERPMYSPFHVSQQRHGLEFSVTAREAVSKELWCAICKVPPAPKTLLNPADVETWVHDYGHLLGGVRRGGAAVDPAAYPRPANMLRIEDSSYGCLCCESQLRTVVGLSDELLELVIRVLDHDQLFFVEDQLLLNICGLCATSAHALREDGDSLIRRFIDVRHGGDFSVFKDAGYADFAQSLARTVNACAKDVTV